MACHTYSYFKIAYTRVYSLNYVVYMLSGSSEEKYCVSGMLIVLGVGVRVLSASCNGCQDVQRHGTVFLSDRPLSRKKLHKPKAVVL